MTVDWPFGDVPNEDYEDSKRLTYKKVETPEPGDIAIHKSGTLDGRQVSRVEKDQVYLYIGLLESGPFSVDNYTFKRREWV